MVQKLGSRPRVEGVGMFSPCSANLTVSTVLRQLVSAKIERIDNALKDVTFQRQSGVLAIKGWVTCQIIYRNSAGRLQRHVSDFQFQVGVQEAINELSPLTSDLKQVFYIFDPANGRLDQSFLVSVREEIAGPNCDEQNWLTVSAPQIIESGTDSTHGRISVNPPDNCGELLNFTGSIRFYIQQELWMTGVLYGIIRYRDLNHRLSEFLIENPIDFIDSPPKNLRNDQELLITGEIASHSFFHLPNLKTWVLAVNVDYHWSIMEPKKIRCMTVLDENEPNSLVIQSCENICRCSKEISRHLSFPVEIKPTEINCLIEDFREKPTKDGVVITGNYWIDIYGIDPNENEICRSFHLELIELVPAPGINGEMKDLRFNSTLVATTGPFEHERNGISLMVFFNYQATIAQTEFHRLATQKGEGAEFLVKSLLNQRQFHFMGEETIALEARNISEMKDISVCLAQCRTTVEKGWLKLDGLLEVSLSWIDRERGYESKIFELPVSNTFAWDEADDYYEACCHGTVESQLMMPFQDNYHFSYLLRLDCKLLMDQRARLTLYSEKPETGKINENSLSPDSESISPNEGFTVSLDEILSFSENTPAEIVDKNLVLSDVCCNRIGDRLLISGIQEWSLQFWNQSDYFENKVIKIPFWRYLPIQNPGYPALKNSGLSHRILEYDFALMKNRLFPSRKGRLSVRFEISFSEDADG